MEINRSAETIDGQIDGLLCENAPQASGWYSADRGMRGRLERQISGKVVSKLILPTIPGGIDA